MEDILIKVIIGSVATLLTVTVAILLYFLKKKDDELSLIKNKISDEKYKTYFNITSLFFDILKQDKGFVKIENNDLGARYIDIKKNLLLLGSDEVIKKFTEFDKSMFNDDLNAILKIKHWLDLFILIRKDSGNPKTKLTIDDILHSIVQEADYVNVKELIKKVEAIERRK